MKATPVILGMALATSALGTLAAPVAAAEDGYYMAPAAQREWFQAGTFELQDEAQTAKLEREGFPQYAD
jgi:ABC-type sugar transport system substrate-binding protein